jgi:hypothetical protein
MSEHEPETVWAVVLGNYYPHEVYSLWRTKELAEEEMSANPGWGSGLRVVELVVLGEEQDS